MIKKRAAAILDGVRSLRDSLAPQVTDSSSTLTSKPLPVADGTQDNPRSISTLNQLANSAQPLEIPGTASTAPGGSRSSNTVPKSTDLHDILVQENKQRILNATKSGAGMVPALILQTQDELRKKNRKLAEEEFSGLLHASRNEKMSIHNVLLLERFEEVVKENGWVRDLEEKVWVGKKVAQMETLESHCVLACQKLDMHRQEKQKEIEVLKERREVAMKMMAELFSLQKNLEDVKNGSYVP
ncbi:hypothetical protein HDU98_009701 [Podochytrium sp. JEL0797]|nr:hypothetical protein HDU98_009701 [Podochytrium sp. JEL0797]